jgi:hypothetical protein
MMARCAHVMVEHPVSSETRFIRTAAAFYVGPIWSSSTHGPAAHVGVRAIKWMAGCSSNLFLFKKRAGDNLSISLDRIFEKPTIQYNRYVELPFETTNFLD